MVLGFRCAPFGLARRILNGVMSTRDRASCRCSTRLLSNSRALIMLAIPCFEPPDDRPGSRWFKARAAVIATRTSPAHTSSPRFTGVGPASTDCALSPRENGLPRIARRKSLYGLDGVDGQDVIHGIVASATDRDESGLVVWVSDHWPS
jgi:hypothetical protein